MPDSARLSTISRGAASPLARLHRHRSTRWPSSLAGPLGAFAFEADLTNDHLSALVLWVAGGSFIASCVLAGVGVAEGIVMGAAVLLLPVILARRWAGRRTRRLVAALPDVVDMIGRSLRSGASLAQSITEAAADGPATVRHELAAVVGGIRRGQPTSVAMQAWVQRTPRPEVRIVAAALALASRNESGTTQALDGVSHSLRDRAALAAEIRSHSAQAAASMQALVGLPALFLGIDALGSQHTLRFLVGEPLGQLCLIVAILLDLVGWLWMKTIIGQRSPT